jgi:class 3 adenylate cyclase/tetratricopeptide (TPR) repeat protein
MLCVQCHASNETGARFCNQCGFPLSQIGNRSATAPILHGERRQITVLFADIVDSTKLAVALDPEEYQDIVRLFLRCCSDVVSIYEGHVSETRGDGAVVIFGFPISRGDETERAIRAALEIIDALGRLSLPANLQLQARIGITTGVAAIDAETTAAAPIAGDVLNLAARLQTLALPNTVVISSMAKRLAGGFFNLIDLGLHNLKGFPEPIAAWQVDSIKPVGSRFEALRPDLTLFVGRDQELKQLGTLWEKAKRGNGQIVEIFGEAGIGKSRLINQAQRSLCDEQQVAKYSCSPYHTGTALYPAIEQLTRMLQFQAEQSPDQRLVLLEKRLEQCGDNFAQHFCWIARLLSLPANTPQVASQEARERTLEALLWWLTAVSKRQPLLIIVEDAQWIDPTSFQLAQMIVNQIDTMSALFIISFRPPYLPVWTRRSASLSISLDRLDRASAGAIVADLVGTRTVAPAVRDQVIDKADGIPLFIEELTKMVLSADPEDEQPLRVRPRASLTQLPLTLQDLLTARLDQLALAKRVAQVASVIGREFSYELLGKISGLTTEALQNSLDQLVDAGLVYGAGSGTQFTFKHALIRDAAYESLLRRDRRDLHAAVASTLLRASGNNIQAEPELLAHHYTEAGSTSEAIKYWGIAARRSLQVSANAESLAHVTRGLKLIGELSDTPERQRQELELRIVAGWAYWTLAGPSSDEVELTFVRARELAAALKDDEMFNYALRGLFVCFYARGEMRTASKLAEQEIALALKRNDIGDLMLGRWALGTASFWMGEFETARRELTAAIDLYDPALIRAKIFSSQVDPAFNSYIHLSWAMWVLGFPNQAAVLVQRAVGDARQSGNALALSVALFWDGVVKLCCGQLTDAAGVLRELYAVTARYRVAYFANAAIALDGMIMVANGDRQVGVERIHQAITEFKKMRGGTALPWMLSAVAEAHNRNGSPEKAQAVVDTALSFVEKEGERHWEAELYRIKGEAKLAQGDIDEAEALFREAINVAERQKALSLELRATMSLARLQMRTDKFQARNLVAAVYSRFTEGFATADLIAAKSLLDQLKSASSNIELIGRPAACE